MTRARSFDHDEARRLHADGLAYTDIARRLGVHATTVRDACIGRTGVRTAKAGAFVPSVAYDAGLALAVRELSEPERARLNRLIVSGATPRDALASVREAVP